MSVSFTLMTTYRIDTMFDCTEKKKNYLKKKNPAINSSVSDNGGWTPVNKVAAANKTHPNRLEQRNG